MMLKIIAAATFLGWIFGVQISTAFSSQEDIDFFIKNYPEASKLLKERMAKVEGTCRLTRTTGRNKPIVNDATFAADYGMHKVRIIQKPRSEKSPERAETVYCVGPNSEFTLVRTSEATPYSVKGIGTDEKDRTGYLQKFGRFLEAPYSVQGIPLTQIMNQPNFHLTSAEKIQVGGREMMKVAFSMGKAPGASDVRLVLDPSSGWTIRSGELQPVAMQGRAKISFEAEYGSGTNDPEFPKFVKFEDLNGDKFTCEFLEIKKNSRPEDEFKMPYFGLPDMTATASASSDRSMLYWMAGTAVLACLLAWQLRRYTRRRRLDVT